jgi:predicted GNAT family acetyltransferase
VLKDPHQFAELADGWLASDPFSTNVIGVYLGGVLSGDRFAGDDDLWITVIDGGHVVGAAMHTPPYNLFLPRLPVGVASEIARALSGSGRALPGVNGETVAVAEFVGAWTEQTGVVSSLRQETRMYRLEKLRFPAGIAGDARPATEVDRDLVNEWFARFHAEAVPQAPPAVPAIVERRLAAGDLWLWCAEGTPVALAGRSAPAGGVARIGPVYTPPARRRRGYGSAVTARATQAALQAGANDVVLYTDLSNPTSNAIYQSIGYVADHDSQERSLVESS